MDAPIFDTATKHPSSPSHTPVSLPIDDTSSKFVGSPQEDLQQKCYDESPIEDIPCDSDNKHESDHSDSDDETCDHVDLSDSSPARSREMSNLSESECKLVRLFLNKEKEQESALLPVVDHSVFDVFQKTLMMYPNT